MSHCSLKSMGTPLFYFKIEVIIWQIFSGQSLNKNLLSLLFQRNYLNEQIWPVPSDFVKSRFHCTSRGSPLFPFGTERRKFPYHLVNVPVSSLISRKQLREIELQMVSVISFGWFADFGKTLTLYSTVIPTGSFWQMVSAPIRLHIICLTNWCQFFMRLSSYRW